MQITPRLGIYFGGVNTLFNILKMASFFANIGNVLRGLPVIASDPCEGSEAGADKLRRETFTICFAGRLVNRKSPTTINGNSFVSRLKSLFQVPSFAPALA